MISINKKTKNTKTQKYQLINKNNKTLKQNGGGGFFGIGKKTRVGATSNNSDSVITKLDNIMNKLIIIDDKINKMNRKTQQSNLAYNSLSANRKTISRRPLPLPPSNSNSSSKVSVSASASSTSNPIYNEPKYDGPIRESTNEPEPDYMLLGNDLLATPTPTNAQKTSQTEPIYGELPNVPDVSPYTEYKPPTNK